MWVELLLGHYTWWVPYYGRIYSILYLYLYISIFITTLYVFNTYCLFKFIFMSHFYNSVQIDVPTYFLYYLYFSPSIVSSEKLDKWKTLFLNYWSQKEVTVAIVIEVYFDRFENVYFVYNCVRMVPLWLYKF